jgi:ribosomal protein L15
MKVGLISETKTPVKILGEGELSKRLNVTAAAFTASAAEKITGAGGTATATRRGKQRPAAKQTAAAEG